MKAEEAREKASRGYKVRKCGWYEESYVQRVEKVGGHGFEFKGGTHLRGVSTKFNLKNNDEWELLKEKVTAKPAPLPNALRGDCKHEKTKQESYKESWGFPVMGSEEREQEDIVKPQLPSNPFRAIESLKYAVLSYEKALKMETKLPRDKVKSSIEDFNTLITFLESECPSRDDMIEALGDSIDMVQFYKDARENDPIEQIISEYQNIVKGTD